jgi:hypothetical protein
MKDVPRGFFKMKSMYEIGDEITIFSSESVFSDDQASTRSARALGELISMINFPLSHSCFLNAATYQIATLKAHPRVKGSQYFYCPQQPPVFCVSKSHLLATNIPK